MAETRAQGLHIPYPNQLEGSVRVILLPKPHWSVEKFKKWIKTCCHLLEQLHVNWHCQFQTLGTLVYWPLYKRRCGDYCKNADENFLPITISIETVCKFHMWGVSQSFQNQTVSRFMLRMSTATFLFRCCSCCNVHSRTMRFIMSLFQNCFEFFSQIVVRKKMHHCTAFASPYDDVSPCGPVSIIYLTPNLIFASFLLCTELAVIPLVLFHTADKTQKYHWEDQALKLAGTTVTSQLQIIGPWGSGRSFLSPANVLTVPGWALDSKLLTP